MEVVKSFFKPKSKCSGCDNRFGLHRRRKCMECSNSHLEKLFCKQCSVKIKIKKFSSTRYCIPCHTNLTVTPIEEKSRTETLISKDEFATHRTSINIIDQNPENYYQIGPKIGEGGTALVYYAKNLKTHEEVAIKRIMLINSVQREQIIDEIAISQLSMHRNIITVYEVFEYNFSLWIVEELMLCSLNELIEDNHGDLAENLVRYLLREIGNALLVLHANQRIHRDIKAKNILIDQEGSLKLADFGCAAQLMNEESKRNTIVGTADHMAPELALGNDYDEKIDIWSFGILALYIAEGETPYHSNSPMKILMLVATLPAPSLMQPTRWSTEFNEFIAACLKKDPAMRPSIDEIMFHPFLSKNDKADKELYFEYFNQWKTKNESAGD